jgi:small neutral amino acid transporter SnatA (MarC family)
MDAERMVDALQTKELALPAFLLALALPLVAALGRATGWLSSTAVATAVGVVGMLIALLASWFILRGAALASRRIRRHRACDMSRLAALQPSRAGA